MASRASSFFSAAGEERWSFVNGNTKKLLDYILVDQHAIDKVISADITDCIGVGVDHRTASTDMLLEIPAPRHTRRHKQQKVGRGWKPKDEDEYRNIVIHQVRAAMDNPTPIGKRS